MVAHHEPVARLPDPDQPQVERRLVEQVETGFTFLLEQRLQPRFVAFLRRIAPVLIIHGGGAGAMNDLQHVLTGVPAERGTQRFMPCDHGLPGLSKTLRVQRAVDAVAVLHVIQPGARLQQGVQQHAFLHGGQRVHVFDALGGHRQRVQLRLSERGQREVRRRQAPGTVAHAMRNQRFKLAQVVLRQRLHGGRFIALSAEGPAQQQLAAVDLTVDAQLVGQRRLRVMGRPDRFIQRPE